MRVGVMVGPERGRYDTKVERLRAEAASLEHDLESGATEAWTVQDLVDLEEVVRAETAVEDLEARRSVVRNVVSDVRVDPSGRCLRARFRVPPMGVRILSRIVQPAGVEPLAVGSQTGHPSVANLRVSSILALAAGT